MSQARTALLRRLAAIEQSANTSAGNSFVAYVLLCRVADHIDRVDHAEMAEEQAARHYGWQA